MKIKKVVSVLLVFVFVITVSSNSMVKAATLPNYTGFSATKTISLSVNGVKIYDVKLTPGFTIIYGRPVKTGQGSQLVYEHPAYNVRVALPSGASDNCVVYRIEYKLKTSSSYESGSVYCACGSGDGTVQFVKLL